MTRLEEEKLSDEKFVSLGTLVFHESRGMVYAGAKTLLPRDYGEYLSSRLADAVIVTPEGVRPHAGRYFSIIGDKIVWEEGNGEDMLVCREDGLRHPAYYIGGYKNIDEKLVFAGKDDEGRQFLWVDGETGPLVGSIYDVTPTSRGIGYTAYVKGNHFCILDGKRTSFDLTEKLFEHDGKIGCVHGLLNKEGTRVAGERIILDDRPYTEPCQEIWSVKSINGKLVHVVTTGSLFQSGTLKGGFMDGWPAYDLSSDYGKHVFVDNQHIVSGWSPDIIPLGDGLACIIKHSKGLQDKNEKTEIVVFRSPDDIQRFHFEGTGYVYAVGGKAVFLQNYGKDSPRIFREDELVCEGFEDIISGYSAIVDVDGKIGTVVRKEKGYEAFPTLDGVISGEPIRCSYYGMPSVEGAFDGNVVLVEKDIYSPYVHLSVGGKTHGSLAAVTNPVFKDGKLHFVVSKEEGTYLWTFHED
jgi:hypothetical protein